jgi:hypothetical protein
MMVRMSFSVQGVCSASGAVGIFCQICKAQRFTRVAVVDVTTMNFNLLFEIGFALGLGSNRYLDYDQSAGNYCLKLPA